MKCRANEESANSIFTTSIEIAIYLNDGEGAGILMGNADIALYRAKQQGRNNRQRYSGYKR